METLIELGSERGAPEPELARPPRARRLPRAAVAVAACGLLVGPAAPTPDLPSVTGPDAPVGAAVLTAGESLLLAEPPVLSAYDAAEPHRPRWRVPVDAAAGWSAEAAGDLLLIAERGQLRHVVATTARSARTGEPRWRRPDRVYIAGDGAVAATEVRSSVDPGRRVEGAVHGVDLATGRSRWSVPVPSTATVTVLPDPPARVLVVHDSGLARLHDVHSGAALAESRLPAADYAPDNPQVVGDWFVLRHPTARGTVVAGYHLPTFERRWQRRVDGGELTVRTCAHLVCLHQGPTRWALRPDTGAAAWTWPDGGAWRAVSGRRAAEPMVLLRPAAGGARQLVAVVGPDGPRVQGVLPADARNCRAAALLVCRTGERLTVWTLPGT